MTKTLILEQLGFYLARVLILQATNDGWKSRQSASFVLVDLENCQQPLGIDFGTEQDIPSFLMLNNRNAD